VLNCFGKIFTSLIAHLNDDYSAIYVFENVLGKYFSDQPELNKSINADRCLCNENCDEIRIIITMAIMKKIGPHM